MADSKADGWIWIKEALDSWLRLCHKSMQLVMKQSKKTYLRVIVLVLVIVWFGSFAVHASIRPEPLYSKNGAASFYARRLHGQFTANGERYNKEALTAAHPDLAFGTIVHVTNLKNGKTVSVRINDRGPFVKGRILDLSYAAAKQLGMLRDGVIQVRITQVG